MTNGGIDTHVHIFRRDSAMAENRRYTPNYDALPGDLLDRMAEAGVAHAVLVQPSFLGTDNSFLIAAIAEKPVAFSGIAVVDPDIDRAALAGLKAAGIHGVRLNCIGSAAPDFYGTHRTLADHLHALGMIVQIQAEGEQWQALEPFLTRYPGRVVVDHFGRTAPDDGSGGFESLLRAARYNANLWFKFSAPYRLAQNAAAVCARALLANVSPRRIIWGSDWPHTQFEGRHSYRDTLSWLADWVPNADDRQAILCDNAEQLFGRKLRLHRLGA